MPVSTASNAPAMSPINTSTKRAGNEIQHGRELTRKFRVGGGIHCCQITRFVTRTANPLRIASMGLRGLREHNSQPAVPIALEQPSSLDRAPLLRRRLSSNMLYAS